MSRQGNTRKERRPTNTYALLILCKINVRLVGPSVVVTLVVLASWAGYYYGYGV